MAICSNYSLLIICYWLVVSTPLKNISQLGLLFPIYGKIKHVPKHQPGYECSIYVLIMIIVYKDSLSNLSNTGHPSIFSECTFMGHIRLACGLGETGRVEAVEAALKPWENGDFP